VEVLTIDVTSLALDPADPPPDTLTWFTCGEVALAATLTVTVMAGYADPPAKASLREHAFAEQFHPLPVIDTNVRPAGNVSVTVTVPLAGPVAKLFITVTV
jgi:hypothetical protein